MGLRVMGRQWRKRLRSAWDRKTRTARQILFLAGLLALEAGLAHRVLARLGEWKPTLQNFNSALSFESAYTTDDKTNNQGLNNTQHRQAYREALHVSGNGYVYHPDLLEFNVLGSFGANQSSLDTAAGQSTGSGGYDAYSMKMRMFRAKPYNLIVSSKQDRPFTSSLDANNDELNRESDLELKYKKGRQSSKMQYRGTTRLSDVLSSSIDDYNVNYTYAAPRLGRLENFNVNTSVNFEEQKDSGRERSDEDVTSQQASLGNSFDLSMANFFTGIDVVQTDLSTAEGWGYSADHLGLLETITLDLPWNFDSLLQLSTSQNDSSNNWTTTFDDSSALAAMQSDASDTNHTLNFTLSQELYDSLKTELRTKIDSLQTTRDEQGVDPTTGVAFTLEPVLGESRHEDYSLSSNYQKMLPHASSASGSIYSNSTHVSRVGLSSEPTVFSPVAEQGGIIRLPDTTDTGAPIIVEVLQDNDLCTAAVKNPRAASSCWIPLVEAADYDLNRATREITIGILSDGHVPGLNLDSFRNPASGQFNFTFRVTTYLTAADATAQTNSLSLGLYLFDLVSTQFQHTVTTQEGNYAGSSLTPKVTEDSARLGLTYNSFRASATRNWIQTEINETINRYVASYDRSMLFFNRLNVGLATEAFLASTDSTEVKNDAQSEEKGYSYRLDLATLIPYIKVNLKADHSYVHTQGRLNRQVLNSEGISVPTQDLGIDEQTIIYNAVALNKALTIPWVEFVVNSYIRYMWRSTRGDDTLDTSNLNYGVSTGRSWRLGSTFITLSANYAITDEVFDDTAFFLSSRKEPREEQTNITTLVLKVVRQLF